MGLLDYYRQFDDMSESEINKGLREKRAAEKALALEHVPVIDLSGTEWPEMPDAEVVGSAVYQARGRLNGYPDERATQVRRALAELHYVKADQIVIGNGAADLIQTAAYVLLSAGDELIVPWPSYSLYPTLAAKAGASTVTVELSDSAIDPQAILDAVTERTRMVVICNPNEPTGTYIDSQRLGELLGRLPKRVHVILDEAFIHFQEAEDVDACLKLTEAFPRLLVVRTFSKIYGLSGLRAGYVVGSPAATDLLGALSPALGVNALSQAAIAQALKVDRVVRDRREMVIEQRARLLQGFDRLRVQYAPTQANFVWFSVPGVAGDELADRLELSRVRVASGAALGDKAFVRAAIRDQSNTDRLLWAVEQALAI